MSYLMFERLLLSFIIGFLSGGFAIVLAVVWR
jgi:hypothetical protein